MLIRICLIVAVVAGLAVGVINFVQVKKVITTTRTDLNNTSNTLVQTEATLTKTEKDLKGTKAELEVTKTNLETTKTARDQALADAETNRKRSADLTEKLKETTKQRDDAQADLAAWVALGIRVDEVKRVIADFKESLLAIDAQKAEIKLLNQKKLELENELLYYRDPEQQVKLPEGLSGKVLVYDPKWDFVILNVGRDQGVLDRGELYVHRGGKLVARVRVFDVKQDTCIANTIGGFKFGDIVEGDSAFPVF